MLLYLTHSLHPLDSRIYCPHCEEQWGSVRKPPPLAQRRRNRQEVSKRKSPFANLSPSIVVCLVQIKTRAWPSVASAIAMELTPPENPTEAECSSPVMTRFAQTKKPAHPAERPCTNPQLASVRLRTSPSRAQTVKRAKRNFNVSRRADPP